MTRLEELQQKFERECSINTEQGTDLHRESLKTSDMLVSWVSLYVKENRILKKLKIKQSKVYQDLKGYYSGKAAPEVYQIRPLNDRILRTDIDNHIKTDPLFLEIQEQIDEQESIVDLCLKATEALKNRSFLIKNAIDYLKFLNGV